MSDIFQSVLTTTASGDLSIGSFLLCTAASLILGLLIALLFCFRSHCSRGFAATLALLPAIVQTVIMLVNGNLGTGIAVMGAFNLVRFRSAPGSAREICAIFLAMAVGLASGMGYLAIALVFTVIVGAASLLLTALGLGKSPRSEKDLKITIPEGLDYTGVFDDLFAEYTLHHELYSVRTTNMGSLFKLTYRITLKDSSREKAFIDALRCRNGNLEIICSRVALETEGL